MTDTVEFAVVHPQHGLSFHTADSAELSTAIGQHVPDKATQGMGPLRAWFSDTFTAEMDPNPLAAHILGAIGYDPYYPWRGTVVLTADGPPTAMPA
jgi:hypothetical protein